MNILFISSVMGSAEGAWFCCIGIGIGMNWGVPGTLPVALVRGLEDAEVPVFF